MTKKTDQALQRAPVQFENLDPVPLPAVTSQVDGLLQLAIQQGMPVESLKELVGLRNDELKRLAKASFVRAMSRFQSLVPPIHKNKTVSFGEGTKKTSYKHAQLYKIAEAIKGPMMACELSYRWEIQDKQEGSLALITVSLIVTHVDGHSETTSMTGSPDGSGSKNSIQQRGSTITYLQRYTLIGALGLTTADEDVDGQQDEEEVETISEDQFTQLHALLTDAGFQVPEAINAWLNKAAQAVAGVKTIGDLPADKFTEAKEKLKAGIAEKQRGSAAKK